MIIVAITLVILSGLIHSIWNLFTKKSINKNVFLWFCQLTAIIIFLPLVVVELKTSNEVPITGYLLVFASMAFHGFYIILNFESPE